MDIDARPFGLDEKLLQQRRRQRELLAAVPDWWLDRNRPPLPEAWSGPRAGLVERYVRDLADEAIQPAVDWLNAAREGAKVEETEAALLRATSSLNWFHVLDPTLAVIQAAKTTTRVPREVREGTPLEEALRGGVTLLAWADTIGGDYTDPRLLDDDSLA